nr:biliverdin-producing heme oxygenase [Roseospira navarrensis]
MTASSAAGDEAALSTPDDADRAGGDPVLMARLRAATRDVHDALHEHHALGDLLAPSLGARRYRHILECFDGFLAAAEREVLVPADGWFAANGFHRVSRRYDLARDLTDLREAGAAPPPEPAPERPPGGLGVAPGEGAALGVLYVVEGSRLGGRGLARHLGRALPRSSAMATRFLGSPGVDIGAHWRQVGALINTLGRDPARADAAVGAACAAFSALTAWFDEAP